MNKLISALIFLIIGGAVGYHSHRLSLPEQDQDTLKERKPSYWVAPMDSSYRRDEPGNSPMGMPLVPVYEALTPTLPGTVTISATVQNTLGVKIAAVDRGRFDLRINTVGYVSFDEDSITHIHTRVDGWLEKLWIKSEGEAIKKGQKLFELYSPALVNAQEDYLSALKSKNKALIQASHHRLVSQGMNPQQVKQLRRSKTVQQRVSFYSDRAAYVAKFNVGEGQFVKPSTEIMSLGGLSSVWVIAEIFERQSSWIKPDQKVEMRIDAYPGRLWQGHIDYIYPTLDAKTRTLRARIRFANPDQALKPNMFAKLTLLSPHSKNTLFIPRAALIRNARFNRVVKALGHGQFRSVAVRTGIESGHRVEILSGLHEGDQIVTSAQFLIDSESNLTASFLRMEEGDNSTERVFAQGRIETINTETRQLSIHHQAVEAWNWPSMLMEFKLAPTVEFDGLTPQQEIKFCIERFVDGRWQISEIITDEQPSLCQSNPENKDAGEEKQP